MAAKLTVNSAAQPAAPTLPKPSDEESVADSLGRTLTIKEPGVLDESRLARLMGDSSTSIGYMLGYVTPAAMVIAIDGEPLPFPRTELQVDAAIQRLGREGIGAVMSYLTKKASANEGRAEDIKK